MVNSIIYLLILTIIVSVITYSRILVQIDIGPISDSFDFLSNALVFAGQSIGYSDLLRPPVFPFIISLVFRLGYISTNTIFFVDGILFVFGVIGLFLLLKIRFNNLESFLGGLLYSTFPIVLQILGVGFSDLASVSFSIWAIYWTVLAVKNDSKFFYLGFPFLMLAFLTRYNSALLIFPIFLYLLINRDKVKLKNFIIGIITTILIIIPVLIFFYEKFGNLIYPFINFGTSSIALTTSSENFAYNPNIFYFIQNLPDFVGPQGIFILLIIALGIIMYLILNILMKNQNNQNVLNQLYLKINRKNLIKVTILVIVTILFLLSFGKIFYMVNELLFFFISYLFYDLTKNFKIKYMDLNFMIFSWFMAFLIFNSIYIIKDSRYFVLMAPSVAYFMILGLSELSNKINLKIINRNSIFSMIAVILTVIMLFSSASLIPNILESNHEKLIANEQMKLTSQWFVNYDPNYKNENLYSDLSPNFSWYLKTNVKQVPIFKDNQTFANNIKNYTFNQEDSNQFNNYLITNNADYYFCVREGLNLTSYYPIKELGYVTIYKKKI